MRTKKPQVNSPSRGQAVLQKEPYPPTGQPERVVTNEELRVKFPAFYDWEIYQKTDIDEIIRQSNERERLILQGSRLRLNSAIEEATK